MSIVRWSKDSDLYIFEHVNGHIECCGCCLEDKNVQTTSIDEMVGHVEKHLEAGHLVPEWVIPALREYHFENEAIS